MRKILAFLASLLIANPALAATGPKFSNSGGIGSATSTYSAGEPTGGTYSINGTTGAASFGPLSISGNGTYITSLANPVSDGAAQTFQTSSTTAHQIYGPLVPAGYNFFDGIRSVVDTGASASVQTNSAIGAYFINRKPVASAPAQNNGVGLYSEVVNAVDNASSWTFNGVCVDNTTNGAATLVGRKCIGAEYDFQVNGSSTIEGLSLIIQGVGTPVAANALQVSRASGSNAGWINGIVVDDAASTSTAIQIGASSVSGSSVPSLPIRANYFNASSVERYMQIQASNGALNFSSSDPSLPDAPFLQTGNANVTIGVTGTSTNANINFNAKGSGTIIFNSPTNSLNVAGSVTVATFVKLPVYTVATLPTCNTGAKGEIAAVSDANAPTYNATLTGGGAVSIPVYCNGTNWTAH